MGNKMNAKAYTDIVKQDKEWLMENSPRSLERDHIIAILEDSAKQYNKRFRIFNEESDEMVRQNISQIGDYSSNDIDTTLFSMDIFVDDHRRCPTLERRLFKYSINTMDGRRKRICIDFRWYDGEKPADVESMLLQKEVILVVSKYDRCGNIVAQQAFSGTMISCTTNEFQGFCQSSVIFEIR